MIDNLEVEILFHLFHWDRCELVINDFEEQGRDLVLINDGAAGVESIDRVWYRQRGHVRIVIVPPMPETGDEATDH